MRLILTLLLTAVLTTSASADKRSAKRPGAHRPPTAVDTRTAAADTLHAPADTLVFISGYDKPLRSNYETILVTNRLDAELTAIGVTITYRDLSGRQLHRVTRTLRAVIPPGETRLVRFRSWDIQQTYYYAHGIRPRTSGVTPYDISLSTDYAVINRH